VVKDKIKVLDKLVKESESVLAVTKTHSKNAKKYEEEAKVSAATAKKLGCPIAVLIYVLMSTIVVILSC
jgi:hypothetical protein